MKKKAALVFFTLCLSSFGFFYSIQEKEIIIGEWKNTETPEWKWVFTKEGKCYDYLDNQLSDTYNYSIESTSPQCDQNVPTGELFSYLKLVNVKDANDLFCYEILSLDETMLQIRWLERGGFISFTREN